MKIEELEFKSSFYGTVATVEFKNGYGASIITGERAYTSVGKPYEVAVLKNGELNYETPITDDVLGHQDAQDVERVLSEIASLPCFACCERFAKEAGRLQSPAGGGLLYPYEMLRGSQFDRDDDGTWNIAGCCGGCYVVTEMKFCPFCGADLLKQNVERGNDEHE